MLQIRRVKNQIFRVLWKSNTTPKSFTQCISLIRDQNLTSHTMKNGVAKQFSYALCGQLELWKMADNWNPRQELCGFFYPTSTQFLRFIYWKFTAYASRKVALITKNVLSRQTVWTIRSKLIHVSIILWWLQFMLTILKFTFNFLWLECYKIR